jgi:hypothetical protein
MSEQAVRLRRLGRVAFISSGVLFLVTALLEFSAGKPTFGTDILHWVDSQRTLLALQVEVLFFADLALVPAVAVLYATLARAEPLKALTGCGILAVIVPVIAVLVIVLGRLAFPVYGFRASTFESATLVLGMYDGGMHAVAILLGIATLVLALGMSASFGRPVAWLGLVAGVLDLVGSYPWIIGPQATLGCQTVSAAWLVSVGARLPPME